MNKHEISNKIESLKEELKYGAGEETDFYELGRLYELQFGEKGKYKKTNSQTILDCYNKAIEQNPFYIPAVQKKAEFLCSNGSLSEKTVSEIKNEIEKQNLYTLVHLLQNFFEAMPLFWNEVPSN